MKLHLQTDSSTNLFTAYDAGYVAVNGIRHDHSLIVLPGQVITEWQPAAPDIMTAEHFNVLADIELEILLLGTGPKLRFPSPRLIHALAQRGIGLEAMDTFAACRTYNILAGDGRKVAAALIL
ncbi:MAG: Mth938-like domain-containing protein [Sulfuricella denitrificans]|nr:Mth938-like domain-containing protein [Sulfuricella denitrificans]